ncbi:MAG: AtpZ/AtpI family protein [Asticcacaulis sp.]
MTHDPDQQGSELEQLEDIDRKLKAIEARKSAKTSSHAENEMGAGKGYQALGELLGGIFVGLGLGWLSDTYLNTGPFGVIAGTIGGMIIGVYLVAKSANGRSRQDSKKD